MLLSAGMNTRRRSKVKKLRVANVDIFGVNKNRISAICLIPKIFRIIQAKNFNKSRSKSAKESL